MPKPLEWIGQAPPSIDEFKNTFPHVYGTVFAEAGPRKMPMSEIDWNMLASGTRCRQSAGTCTAQVTAMMAQGTSSHELSAPAGVPFELTQALTGLTQLLGQLVARQGQAEQDQHCPLVFNDGHLGGQRGQRERESAQGMSASACPGRWQSGAAAAWSFGAATAWSFGRSAHGRPWSRPLLKIQAWGSTRRLMTKAEAIAWRRRRKVLATALLRRRHFHLNPTWTPLPTTWWAGWAKGCSRGKSQQLPQRDPR